MYCVSGLFHDGELHTTVVLTALVRFVGVNRTGFAITLRSHAAPADTLIDQIIGSGLCTTLGQTLVVCPAISTLTSG